MRSAVGKAGEICPTAVLIVYYSQIFDFYLLISAALCNALDGKVWGLAESEVIKGRDPMAGMGEVY